MFINSLYSSSSDFSCALVSDILLQGHMYITANYFAFYSNVFGFVTKLLIPVVSVERISKEKMAKIIPNAIGVATADERHVFGSFMSRESAFRLMISVWRPTELPETPTSTAEAAAAAALAAAAAKQELPVDVSECSIEEDSSCSVSGNESPTVLKDGVPAIALVDQQTLLVRQRMQPARQMETSSSSGVIGGGGVKKGATDAVDGGQLRLRVTEAKNGTGDLPSTIDKEGGAHRLTAPGEDSGRRGVTLVVAQESRMAWLKKRVRQVNWKFPTDIHIVYLGVILAVILALFSGFLLYRIMDIQARTSHDYNWVGEDSYLPHSANSLTVLCNWVFPTATKPGTGHVRGGAQVAARDPGEERGGDAEYSEYQFGADLAGEEEGE